jgi:hypothetical protein
MVVAELMTADDHQPSIQRAHLPASVCFVPSTGLLLPLGHVRIGRSLSQTSEQGMQYKTKANHEGVGVSFVCPHTTSFSRVLVTALQAQVFLMRRAFKYLLHVCGFIYIMR